MLTCTLTSIRSLSLSLLWNEVHIKLTPRLNNVRLRWMCPRYLWLSLEEPLFTARCSGVYSLLVSPAKDQKRRVLRSRMNGTAEFLLLRSCFLLCLHHTAQSRLAACLQNTRTTCSRLQLNGRGLEWIISHWTLCCDFWLDWCQEQ